MRNEFSFFIDSRYIYAKEFLFEDAVNVSTDEEDATKRCNPMNSRGKQNSSPQGRDCLVRRNSSL